MQDIIIESSNQSSGASTKVRKVRITTSRGIVGYLFDLLVKSLFVALLFGTNFLLFVGAGKQAVFENGFSLTPEIGIVLGCFTVVAFLLMFLVSFSAVLQNLVVSCIVGGFVLALLNQFSLYDAASILVPMLSPFVGFDVAMMFDGYSQWILSIGVGILTFIILLRSTKISVIYFVGIFVVIFMGLLADNFLTKNPFNNFVVKYDNYLDKPIVKNPKKYVYIFLPNATSYITLGEMKNQSGKTDDAEKIKGRLIAFLAKNGFWVYPNAYVTDTDTMDNTVELLNNLDDKKADEHTLRNVQIDGLWDFSGNHDEYVFLRNAKLVDVYKNSGYRITALNSRGIDLCKKNNSQLADKCIDKINAPVDMGDFQLDNWKKAQFLLLQWFNNMRLVSDWSFTYGLIDGFVDAAKLPIMGVSYDSLYVVNSFKMLDVLLEEIEKNKGNRAYFVFLDLPSDMYVYNEFCKVKSQDKWLNLENNKWVHANNLFEKRKAYQEQFSCLIGKLEQFMRELHNRKLDENTVVFLQGVSGVNVLGGPAVNDFTETFKYKHSVLFAVKDPKRNNFSINNQMCESRELLKNYLYLKGDCKEFNGLKVHSSVAKELQKTLLSNVLKQNTINEYLKNYDEWYEKWIFANQLNSNKNKALSLDDKDKNENINLTNSNKKESSKKDVVDDTKPEVGTLDKPQFVDLPEEREVGVSEVVNNPIDEGKEQEVLTIKDVSEQENIAKTNTLENDSIPLENVDSLEDEQKEKVTEVEASDEADMVPEELKKNVFQHLEATK